MKPRAISLALAMMGVAGSANATWSIIIVDTRTREVGIASATCLNGLDLRSRTPTLVVEHGAGVGQSFGDQTNVNRTIMRDGLLARITPPNILATLASSDPNHQTRQYGIVDVWGGAATFSGSQNGAWAGGQTGQIQYTQGDVSGTYVYSVQGNVLTGPGVVSAAVAALQATPGDLPTRLMAGMQAARLAGGDGRCSCNAEAPTACGDPPNQPFTNSSYIAFYMIARAGDEDVCMPVYPLSGNVDVLPAQLVGSSLPEVVTLQSAPASVRLYTNMGDPGDAPQPLRGTQAGFWLNRLALPTGSTVLGMGNITGGTNPDVITALQGTPARIAMLPNSPAGLGEPELTTILGNASEVLVGDLDNDGDGDVLLPQPTQGRWEMLRNRTSEGLSPRLVSAASIANIPQGTAQLALVDVDGDARPDVIASVPSPASGLFRWYRQTGDFAFGPATDVPIAPAPTRLRTGDIDADGDVDVVTLHTNPFRVQCSLNSAGTFVPQPSIPLTLSTDGALAVGDLNADGFDDVAAAGANRITILLGGATGLTLAGSATYVLPVGVTPSIRTLRIADVDGDADGDLILRQQSSVSGWAVLENVANESNVPLGDPGSFLNPDHCAAGTYFMNFNVINAQLPAPDPIQTLQEQFDNSRTAQLMLPDAIRTLVTPPTNLVAQGPSVELVIDLRNWQGQDVPAPAGTQVVVTNLDGQSNASIATPTQPSPSRFAVSLSPTLAGQDTLRISIEVPGQRPIVLMPRTTISIAPWTGVCDGPDFNNDGALFDPVDIDALLSVYAEGPCIPSSATCGDIDINNDGALFDPCDIDAFLLIFSEGPCTPCGQ